MENAGSDDINPDDALYCKAVIHETLRLFPPAPFTTRTLEQSLTLRGGTVIPAETWFGFQFGLHNVWKNTLIGHWNSYPSVGFRKASLQTIQRLVRTLYGKKTMYQRQYPSVIRKAFFAFSAGARSCAVLGLRIFQMGMKQTPDLLYWDRVSYFAVFPGISTTKFK